MAIMATIRLAPGQVGYFDELTRLHLTISKPQDIIFAGMNTSNIKRSVKSGRLLLVSGTLDPETNIQNEVISVESINDQIAKQAIIKEAETNGEKVQAEEDVKEEEIIEEVKEKVEKVEEIKEEVVETEKIIEEIKDIVEEVVEVKEVEVATVEVAEEAEAIEEVKEEVKKEVKEPAKKATAKKKSTK